MPAPHDDAQDTRLMQQLARGDGEALSKLCERHQTGLYTFFRRLGAGAHDAEDAVQETLLRLHRAAESYEPRAPFRAFLYVIARNTWCDLWRRRERRPTEEVILEGALSDRDTLGARQDRLDLEEAIAKLPLAHRLVVTLSLNIGLQHREIAEVLEIPEGTVKSRMYHAVRKLGRSLDGVASH